MGPLLRTRVMKAALSGSYAQSEPDRVLASLVQRREELNAFTEYQEKLAVVGSAKDPLLIQQLKTRIAELNRKFPRLVLMRPRQARG